jgi:ligand-binding sensor domain-containing protein/signal transduction histidine kinase
MARGLLPAILLVAFASSLSASAQPVRGRLPLEPFTAAQGLVNDSVTHIVRDSRGFLWFGTLDGLSRYDGARFVNYTTDDGIPDRMIFSIAEDRRGALWVATHDGLARMSAAATRTEPLFHQVTIAGKTVDASVMHIDARGTVWAQCGIDLCTANAGRLEADPSFTRAGGNGVHSITSDPAGVLWIGTHQGVFRRALDGSWRRYRVHPHRGGDYVHGLRVDDAGRVWMGTGFGVIIFAPSDDDRDPRPLIERAGRALVPGSEVRLPDAGEVVSLTAPSPSPIIRCLTPFLASDGAMWIPSVVGLLRVAGGRFDLFDARDGLPAVEITAVGEDLAGDIWIGTRGAGALRYSPSGARSYSRAHGLANERIMALIPLDDGSLCASTAQGTSCFRGGSISHGAMWPRGTKFLGWGWNQIVARDRDGSWWASSGEGLIHWPATQRIEELERTKPLAVYTMRDGLDSDDVFRVWQDSRGMLWIGTTGLRALSTRDPRTGEIRTFGEQDGYAPSAPSAFAEDRRGNVWIGLYSGGLVRVANGRFEAIRAELPSGFVRDLKVDSQGRLWIAATGGVARIDNPAADQRAFAIKRFTRADGLSANSGYCIVELPDGRFAIGSQRGLDVLDLRDGSVIHLTSREGLASNEVSVAALDRSGALWLGTVNGLSRLDRIPGRRAITAPQPRIHSVQIDGVPQAVAELGTASLGDLRIEHPQRTMAVVFAAPHFDRDRPLHFEYRLASDVVWNDAGSRNAIVFDQLPAGDGALQIRSVTEDGTASAPARMSFTVVPPFWETSWFLGLAVAVLAALGFAAHRARVGHLVALERVRTRVATDLHDDLGTSLSRISILSEAAKRKSDPAPILDEIADSARGLVDALGDSIWSIDPRRDDVQSLLLRVRHFAAGVFEAQSIAVEVKLPSDVAALPLRPEQRRETYLILKEALNNAAKHAGARQVSVIASADGRSLRIAVKDDGKGIVPAKGNSHRENGGRGVPSMIDRARRAGGKLEIASEPGQGTNVIVEMPL